MGRWVTFDEGFAMAKIGENAVSNAIKRGAEELRSAITGQPVQEAQEVPKPSYDQALAESAREASKDQGQVMER